MNNYLEYKDVSSLTNMIELPLRYVRTPTDLFDRIEWLSRLKFQSRHLYRYSINLNCKVLVTTEIQLTFNRNDNSASKGERSDSMFSFQRRQE